ncbi:hypothetical protein [Tissierella praeacuta]|uniref:hypothetical protein n=1 Tax=Tissierella praeacuta TaxID=43131 RepID=UPI0033429478
MNSAKRAFRFQKYGSKKSILGFWSVILTINILTYILSIYFNPKVKIGLFNGNDDLYSIAGANLMPIFIFFIVYGISMYHEDFALALSFGITRKDFYKSVIVDNIIVTSSFAAIQCILQIVDKHIIESLGHNPMVEFGLFNTSTNNILSIFLVSFIIFLALVSVTNLLGVLHYRFGYKFWIGFALIFIVLQMSINFITRPITGISELYSWLISQFGNSTIFILEFLIIIICYTIGYFLMRKANIRK